MNAQRIQISMHLRHLHYIIQPVNSEVVLFKRIMNVVFVLTYPLQSQTREQTQMVWLGP